MEYSCQDFLPHSYLLEALFAFKRNVSSIYRDILGIHEVDHIAITQITTNNQLLILSSTPAMEFNLFSGSLWRYDRSYNPQWFGLKTSEYWHNLYHSSRYDELYYLKQIKHAYPLGIALASEKNNQKLIYSLASHKSCAYTHELFANQIDDFYKIGHYCFNLLEPLFQQCNARALDALTL
jgi:hypothetical protein